MLLRAGPRGLPGGPVPEVMVQPGGVWRVPGRDLEDALHRVLPAALLSLLPYQVRESSAVELLHERDD